MAQEEGSPPDESLFDGGKFAGRHANDIIDVLGKVIRFNNQQLFQVGCPSEILGKLVTTIRSILNRFQEVAK